MAQRRVRRFVALACGKLEAMSLGEREKSLLLDLLDNRNYTAVLNEVFNDQARELEAEAAVSLLDNHDHDATVAQMAQARILRTWKEVLKKGLR